MKKTGLMLSGALLLSLGCNSAFAIRRNTVRIICGTFGVICGAGAFEALKRNHNQVKDIPLCGSLTGKAVISAATALVAGGIPYLVLREVTPESYLEAANYIIGDIEQTNPIAVQSYVGHREALFDVLRSLYFSDMWLIKAKNDLEPLKDRIIDALNHLGTAKESATGDKEFVAQCDDSAKRARKMLQNISVALNMIEEGISENQWESNRA